MRKKLALMIAAAAAAIALLVPATSSAQLPEDPACVEVHGPNGLHLVVGYVPTSPADCTQIVIPPAA